MNVRKNQATLAPSDWDAFVDALNKLHGMGIPAPRYRDFVRVHVDAMSHGGMGWGVHTMMGEVGRNFLAWHRHYLVRFERRLQKADPAVTLPYWDSVADPAIPPRLNDPEFVEAWGLERDWDPDMLPTRAQLDAITARGRFKGFQYHLEFLHGSVHNAVGGTMATTSSPADPLFWLHHANVDRIWAEWQRTHKSQAPKNKDEVLQPAPLFGVKVGEMLSVRRLGYRYA